MIELTGITLPQRHKELNSKINDVAKKKINFEKIKSQVEKCDIDKLYKIGIASEYKNVEYIIEIFKSGDSLYISKALKCIWLYDNEYSHIINSEYLHENIFSLMSLKMTKKFLTTISMYINDERAMNFYTYCNRMKYINIAMKFLICTPEPFKLETLKDKKILDKLSESNEFLTLFLGNSFNLAEAYYNAIVIGSIYDQANALYQLRHFYFISNVRYFNLCEKKNVIKDFNELYYIPIIKPLGLRISKDIMKKHKDEIYKNPMIYLYLVNRTILVQYSTVDDAKLYLKTLISYEYPKPAYFWNKNFCVKYDYILDKIPLQERMQFIKHIFNDQYPEEEFETSKQFYDAELFKLMTPEEREKWALRQMESGSELFRCGKDFMWYRFVSFDKAFAEIKKYIQTVVNVDDRTEAISVLAESAKTESELQILFDYYNKKHIKEQKHNKQHFIDAILSKHNVYDFGKSCWDAFNKLLFCTYNSLDCRQRYGRTCHRCKDSKSLYKYVALIHHIIHKKEVPKTLVKFLDTGIHFYTLKRENDKLPKDKVEIVYQYLLQRSLDKIKTVDNKTYADGEKNELSMYINCILDLMREYKKPKQDTPKIVIKYMKLNFDVYKDYLEDDLTQTRLIGDLKKDKELIVSKLPLIKGRIIQSETSFKINTLLKILRTYFSNDLATAFLKLFTDILVESNPSLVAIKTAVYGIMVVADTEFKKDFIYKHVPTEAKIDHSKIDPSTLNIQKSICSMACYSRPPIPLTDVLKYIKGDYVHFCLPMFNSYLNKMPKPIYMEFVKSLLDTPLSVQKHGIRMSFKCFSIEDLRKLILQVWEKTKNISLRSIIYAAVHNKIVDVDEDAQNELFEDLKSFTSSLCEDDDERVFTLLTSNCLPKHFIAKYLEVAWNVVNKLPTEKRKFIELRNDIIKQINWYDYIQKINKEVIESIIYTHVNLMLKQEEIIPLKYRNEKEVCNLIKSKWELLDAYVSFFTDDDDFRKKTDLVMFVIKESLKIWSKVDNHEHKLIVKQFILKFINSRIYEYYNLQELRHYEKINILLEQILREVKNTLANEEIYTIIWEIRVSIITRKVIFDGKQKQKRGTNSNIILKESLNTCAKEFANLLIESIERQQCYVTFFDKIQNACEYNLRKLLRALSEDVTDVAEDNTYVIVCLEILEYNSFETYMFALKLLPKNINNNVDRSNYIKAINKLKSCKYNEIKCYMNKIFVTTDYMYRDFMLTQGDA